MKFLDSTEFYADIWSHIRAIQLADIAQDKVRLSYTNFSPDIFASDVRTKSLQSTWFCLTDNGRWFLNHVPRRQRHDVTK